MVIPAQAAGTLIFTFNFSIKIVIFSLERLSTNKERLIDWLIDWLVSTRTEHTKLFLTTDSGKLVHYKTQVMMSTTNSTLQIHLSMV